MKTLIRITMGIKPHVKIESRRESFRLQYSDLFSPRVINNLLPVFVWVGSGIANICYDSGEKRLVNKILKNGGRDVPEIKVTTIKEIWLGNTCEKRQFGGWILRDVLCACHLENCLSGTLTPDRKEGPKLLDLVCIIIVGSIKELGEPRVGIHTVKEVALRTRI